MILACISSIRTGYILYCKCDNCNKLFTRGSYELYNINKIQCSSKCFGENKKNKSYKTITDIYSKTPRSIPIHRVIIEKYIGRRLLSNELIHHMDKNIKNNNLFNLIIVKKSEHNKLHGKNFLKYLKGV